MLIITLKIINVNKFHALLIKQILSYVHNKPNNLANLTNTCEDKDAIDK